MLKVVSGPSLNWCPFCRSGAIVSTDTEGDIPMQSCLDCKMGFTVMVEKFDYRNYRKEVAATHE